MLGKPVLVDDAGTVRRDALGNALSGRVYFTSLLDDSLGGDSVPSLATTPGAGDWGGLVFRRDLDQTAGRTDWEDSGIFLNNVNQADIRYGGGSVIVDTIPQVLTPIHAVDSRPTVTFSSITSSADAAITATPNSFEETNFHAPRFQSVPFTSDYTRVGPVMYGNRLEDNSINGLLVRLRTPAGDSLEGLTVSGRWDDTEVVHVVAENLRIKGSPGGPIQDASVAVPDARLVTLALEPDGGVPEGVQSYRLTFVDAEGNESPASTPTDTIVVQPADPDTGLTQNVRLKNLPAAPAGYVGRRLYRSVKSEFVLIAELDKTSPSYLDTGEVLGGLLDGSALQLDARLHGRLAVDPGMVVKLNGAGIEASFGSQLIAEGHAGREVIFTSLQDDRYGASGTFATSHRGDAEPGGWTGLYLGPGSSASIDHALVANGGGISEVPGNLAAFNAVEIQQAQARVTHTVFENNAGGIGGTATPGRGGRGTNAEGLIFVRGAQPVIVGNTFQSNAGPAVNIDVNSLNYEQVTDVGRSTGLAERLSQFIDNRGPLVRENRLADNDLNGMKVRGGTLTTEGVWDDTDIVHVVEDETIFVPDFHSYGGLRVQSSATQSLVVKLLGADAGFTATGRPLDITDRIGGMLHVLGQPGYPVVFTSLNDDTVGAGFRPDGSPQTDTNNDGTGAEEGVVPTLPTVPDVPNGVRIDNNVDVNVVGHFELEPQAGGGASLITWVPPAVIGPTGPFGPDGVTAQGNTQLFLNQSFVFDYLNFVDVGADGQAVELSATTITTPPTLVAPDEVISEGTFQGANGLVSWRARSYFVSGVPTLYNEISFSSSSTLGDLRFINYLDEDVLLFTDDLLYLRGQPGEPGFEAYTLDDAERIGFSQGGSYVPGPELVNATFDGWAADAFPDLQIDLLTAGTTYTPAGNIDTTSLTPFVDPSLGQVYGLEDVTTAFAWSVDPNANTATVRTFLNLIPQDPSTLGQYAGDWGSIQVAAGAHDRNVDTAVEWESGNSAVAGVNDVPAEAQYLGAVATREQAGDEGLRLGLTVQGSLNRRGDADVYAFDAKAGTEVWLDIDRTSPALDTVVELIDESGLVLARSDNSLDEGKRPELLYSNPAVETPIAVYPLGKSGFDVQDGWTTNPRDAGMRVVLPGSEGVTGTYHVRVASGAAGSTTGVYQLQVRLREEDEFPGSTVRMAEIRNATTGIEVVGAPTHSPLTGEAAEAIDVYQNDANNQFANAVDLGNLLNTDRGTLSVGGEIMAREVQSLTFPAAPATGNFVLEFNGRTTRNIAYNASAASLESALESLATIGENNVAVTGNVGGPFTIVFQGALANTDVPLLIARAGNPAIDVLPVVTTVATVPATVDGLGYDVDWYRFEVRYDSVPQAGGGQAAHLSTVFDIDYADGLARANSNLWVFDSAGRLILVGRDSDVPADRPIGLDDSLDDLSRGSVGTLDPFIGPVALPAAGLEAGVYYVAVSSNAVMPSELQQYLDANAPNAQIRLEPVNSVSRIAEDHVDAVGRYTTADSPQVPVLFGSNDEITLFAPDGSKVQDGEWFSITNALGNSVTFEFDADQLVQAGRVRIPYRYTDSAAELGQAVYDAVSVNLPASPDAEEDPAPAAGAPWIVSGLQVEVSPEGWVTLREDLTIHTLITSVTTTDFVTRLRETTPVIRVTSRQQEPEVRQGRAPGATDTAMFVSRPGQAVFNLGDVTMFVAEPGDDQFGLDRTELLSVDPYTGQQETRIGVFRANVGDIAMDPRGSVPAVGNGGGLFAYSIPENYLLRDEENSGIYWQINPALGPTQIGEELEDDDVDTFEEDRNAPGTEDDIDVGMLYNAIAFSGPETDPNRVRGFAVGNRADQTVDNPTGQIANGVQTTNILFEFDIETGEVISTRDRTGTQVLTAGGTADRDRGALDTWFDDFTADGRNTVLAGAEATRGDETTGTFVTYIEDADFFQIFDEAPESGDGFVTYEFDTGPEFTIVHPAAGQYLRDGDRVEITDSSDNVTTYEFDTGAVIVVNAATGAQAGLEGTVLTLQDQLNTTIRFEMDSDGVYNSAANHVPILFAQADNQATLAANIVTAINLYFNPGGVPAPAGQPQPLTALRIGNRITLINDVLVNVVVGPNAVPPDAIQLIGASGAASGTAIPVEETMTADEIGLAIASVVSIVTGADIVEAGAAGDRLNFMNAKTARFYRPVGLGQQQSLAAIFTPRGGVYGVRNPRHVPVPFLVSDDAEQIAGRMLAIVQQGTDAVPPPGVRTPYSFDAALNASNPALVELLEPSASFVCTRAGSAPQLGLADCPLRAGGPSVGGNIQGIAFLGSEMGPQLYGVTDTGGLFRVTELGVGESFAWQSENNVLDYIDGSRESLAAVNTTAIDVRYETSLEFRNNAGNPDTIFDAQGGFVAAGLVAGYKLTVSGTGQNDGVYTIDRVMADTLTLSAADALTSEVVETGTRLQSTVATPIRFAGLVAGPQNAEGGRYENLLFGISDTGRLFAFDTWGTPQAVFANAAYFVDTGIANPAGIALANLDDNLWHVTTNRDTNPGHEVLQAFDGSRASDVRAGNSSLYFGYENPQVQSQFGVGAFRPGAANFTYDFPGGSQGSLISNPFSLEGYSAGQRPTLYFDYFLRTEDADAGGDTTLDDPDYLMRDAFRVYVSGDDGRWSLLSTNNSDPPTGRSAEDQQDEFDPFLRPDMTTGELLPEQPVTRSEAFDNDGTSNDWRQARVDLSAYAGQKNLRLRFDFSTAGGLSSGGRDLTLDLNTAGNELRALAGDQLRDGQIFTLTGLVENPATEIVQRVDVAGFEFDFGPTIVAPTGTAVDDGDWFDIDGTVYEFDNDGAVGATNSIPHVPVSFSGLESAGELAIRIEQVVAQNPPAPLSLSADLTADEVDTNDTLATAYGSGLNGTTRLLSGTGYIGDNTQLATLNLDVDLVEVQLDAGDRLVAQTDTQRLATQLDAYLRLFDANGNQLASNDNLDPTSPFVRDARIDYTATRRGTYYVGISAAHNPDYDPRSMGSGAAASNKVPSDGYYEFTISVTDPTGPQRAGNRLNLPNAGSITASGLPASFIDGAFGVRSGLPNPMLADDPTLPNIPVVPVRVNLAMTSLDVADAIRVALADHFGNGNAEAIKVRNETVQIVGYGVGDPGPLGLSGPSDPATALPGSGLFGDLFGAFAASADLNGQTGTGYPGAQRMQDNQHEGVYIDNLLIGFPGRGEMVTGADTGATTFVSNPLQPPDEIDQGAYQLEVRQATSFGRTETGPLPNLQLYDTLQVSEQLNQGVALELAAGHVFREGQSFTVSDGSQRVAFAFDDPTTPGGVADGYVPIEFDPSDSAVVMARRVRDAINQAQAQGLVNVGAASADGVLAGPQSTSNRLNLSDDARVELGLSSTTATGAVPALEPNDTVASAVATGIVAGGRDVYRAAGVIGDNGAVVPFGSEVDLYSVRLAAGETITIDIDATGQGSALDAFLRIFDAAGAPVLQLNEQDLPAAIESDDDVAAGEPAVLMPSGVANRDSFIAFTAPADGDYYIGVSGFDNSQYDPTTLGVGSSDPADFTVYNGELYFTAFTASSGRELWKLTSAGVPQLVADIHPAGSSDPRDLTVFNNELFFTADTPAYGREIWKINTAGTASLVTDVFADGSSDPGYLTVFNNALYFAAFTTATGRELWRTTPGGVASEVEDIDLFGSSDPADLIVFNNELYFSASAPTTGRELWKVDAAGIAALVADLDANGSSEPAGLTEFNGELYFSATTPASGRELWKVNPLGMSSQVTDLEPAAGSSDPAGFTTFNNELYFAATTTATGNELWKIDPIGNVALAADLDPAGSSDPSSLTVFNNELYFSAQGPAGGRELWKLNAAGQAAQVVDLEAAGSSDPQQLSVASGGLYFSAFTTATGRELWQLSALGAASPVADLEQAHRRPGSTGSYELEIRRPTNSNGLNVIRYEGLGDQNLFRDQGQIVIRDNVITDSQGYGITVRPQLRSTAEAPQAGPVRNLSQVNTARLAPGVVVANNVLAYNQAGGVHFQGDPLDPTVATVQPAAVPFGRIVNNTIYGAVRGASQRALADIVLVIDTSGSMADEIAQIRQRIADFDASLRAANIDPRYALVTFPGDGATPLQIQDLVSFAAFTAADSPFNTFAVPAGGKKEYGSLALREALNDVDPATTFTFRPGARVSTVLMTDEEDDSSAADFALALNAFTARNAVFFGLTLNPDLPYDADSATNNTDARYGEFARRTGGQIFDISAFSLDPTPFFESFTAAVTGVIAAPNTTGIRVEYNASPTLLNNVVVAQETGILVDTSSATTVVAGTVYQSNGTDLTGASGEQYPLRVGSEVRLFRDPAAGNFYPAPGSPAIDSALESFEQRLELEQVAAPVGIGTSPLLVFKHDAYGQLRVDDPSVAPPPGLGENVFKDRGAVDRSDFVGPFAQLVQPLDNGGDDLDGHESLVNLRNATLDEFSIQLTDGRPAVGGTPLQFAPLQGLGLDDATVSAHGVSVIENNRRLVPGQDYTAWYDATSNILHIVPLAGVWDRDSNYVIRLQNEDQFVIAARTGDEIADGDSFRIADTDGNSFTFEYDTGFVLTVPETYAIQVPVQGGAVGGVADGDTVTVSGMVGTLPTTATIEFDNNGVIASEDNLVIQFTATTTQGELADALVGALTNSGLGLSPANAGGGLVHLGADGTQTLTVASATLVPQGGPLGVIDGETFTIDNGFTLFTFELSTDGRAGTGRVPVPFTMSQTPSQIAGAIALAVNGQPVGLVAKSLGDGRVQLGGSVNHQVDVTESHLSLSGEPGVQLPFGIRIPTVAGSFLDLIEDGETFVIDDHAGHRVTFELDDNSTTTPGNVAVPFRTTTTTQQLVDTLVTVIRDAGLGLFPYNQGYGIVILGGEGFSLDMTNTQLVQVGISGQPEARAIVVTPDDSFTAQQVAEATVNAIQSVPLQGVTAAVAPDTNEVLIGGAETLSGDAVEFRGSIKDLAGNSIVGNQTNGETRFTVYIGEGRDYGDAPSPYPTVREDDGARHVILPGFSLGATVDINADGQPSAGADGDDNDGGDDEDGVAFDPTTPLVPNRKFTVTVSTSGIVNDVVPFGVLDAWIDYNRDGDWRDTGERILTNYVLNKSALDANGTITFRDLTVPTWAVPGETFARFRLSTSGGLSSTGEASAGEVEDYRVIISANPWQNSPNRYDVNDSGEVSPIDVLLVINYVNTNPVNPLALPKPAGLPFYDVSGDGNATAQDVLLVINEINRLNEQAGGEGEADRQSRLASTAPRNHLEDVLRGDEDWLDSVAGEDRLLGSRSAVDAIFADFGA